MELEADDDYVADAANSGSVELVQWLYASGYAVGDDTLINAVRSGNVDLCKWVVDHGIAPEEDDMIAAVDGGHVQVLEWLSAHGCSCTTDLLFDAVRMGTVPVVAWCLNHYPHPPDGGALLALSCENRDGSEVFEYLADQRGFQISELELNRALGEHNSRSPKRFDAAIVVKRYGIPLFPKYMMFAILDEDIGRLRFALSQGLEVSVECYKLLIMKADATYLNEVLLARNVLGRLTTTDWMRIMQALCEVPCPTGAKKVLAEHYIVV